MYTVTEHMLEALLCSICEIFYFDWCYSLHRKATFSEHEDRDNQLENYLQIIGG